jgi:tRNA-specific 2-thiouridylase
MKILIGMSGGVDSSVAALLLKEAGYDVEGVFMKNWEQDDTDTFCPASQDMADAQDVCDKLQIELHRVNFADEYWERVFKIFLEEYRAGRTPNPDILCNKEIKFKAFLNYAKQRGADKIATGHYARCAERDGKFFLLKGLDNNKDQSYFLHALSQEQLAHSLFPIGEMKKEKVREIAKKAGFENHKKKDSTGICFIGEKKFKQFLNEYLPAQPGEMVIPEGKIIGKHDGLMFYTLGQRQGLKIGGMKNATEEPWYVVAKDVEKNRLVVAQGEHPLLFSNELTAKKIHWISGEPSMLKIAAKTRYRQADQSCIIEKTTVRPEEAAQQPSRRDNIKVIFDKPQRAVTPGQSVVFYQEDICLGGGVITEYRYAR